jgi:hypothetical protein
MKVHYHGAHVLLSGLMPGAYVAGLILAVVLLVAAVAGIRLVRR